MINIDEQIKQVNKVICDNIEMFDNDSYSRGFIAQNILSQLRNLVEHIALKITSNEADVSANWDTITFATSKIREKDKYKLIRIFHNFLEESKSHYTPNYDGAERLLVKYYPYLILLKDLVKNYNFIILENIEKIPINTDNTTQKFYDEIANKLEIEKADKVFLKTNRLYIKKVKPFVSKHKVYFEVTITPALDCVSKFDRFVCYTKCFVSTYYAVDVEIYTDEININNCKMPIYVLSNCNVSIRPCELNNYAKLLLGCYIGLSSNSSEYIGIMNYIRNNEMNLLDIINLSDIDYLNVKKEMFMKSKICYYEKVLDISRDIIKNNRAGKNVLSYLLFYMNNKVIKSQYLEEKNNRLSNLYLDYGCIPFEEMPFVYALKKHIPNIHILFNSIDVLEREYEVLIRHLYSLMNNNSNLYISKKEVENDDLINCLNLYESKLYPKHKNRRIQLFGSYLYCQETFENTKTIIDKIKELSKSGIVNLPSYVAKWIENYYSDLCHEKKDILINMFSESSVYLLYGAAGTGKTYIINIVCQLMNNYNKLLLANTNPAVENLKSKITAQKCNFMTISKAINSKHKDEYTFVIIDECSMVSNSDLVKLLRCLKFNYLLLVGDIHQIEAIDFGNWFRFAKYLIPKKCIKELTIPFRTKDNSLIKFWNKVRNFEDDLTEYMAHNIYSVNLDTFTFERNYDDEIILCLNYDGFYGINNVNRMLQNNNSNDGILFGLSTFKKGDPILFNESNRFSKTLYNNLKGKIVNVVENEADIWFDICIDKVLTSLDIYDEGLSLVGSDNNGNSIVRFSISKNSNTDNDSFIDNTVIPFQIAYAVSIHKAQGLEFDSVKILISQEIDEQITHNIFYTAVTRARKDLKIYWTPETQEKVLKSFSKTKIENQIEIFKNHCKYLNRK